MLAAILILALTQDGGTQAQETPWYDVPLPAELNNDATPPSSGSRDFTFRYRPPVSDTIDARVTVEYTYTDLGEIGHWIDLSCNSLCNAHVHDTHDVCDQSCDEYKHCNHWRIELRASVNAAYGAGVLPGILDGAYKYNRHNTRALRARIVQEANREWRDNLSSFSVPVSNQHWNTTPCTWGYLTYVFRKYEVRARYQMYRTLEGHTDEVEFEGEGLVSHVYVPEKDPYRRRLRVQCWCESLNNQPDQTEYLWPSPSTGTGGDGGAEGEEGEGTGSSEQSFLPGAPRYESGEAVAFASLTGDYRLQTVANDMNSATFTFNPTRNVTQNITISPGFMLVSQVDGYQDMGVVGTIRTAFTFDNPLRGPRSDEYEYKVGILCLNMAKKAPNPGIKYEYMPVQNPMINDLLIYTSKQTLRGPWDQARTWIGTDKATYDEIGEILRPMISEAQYVMALYEAELAARVPLESEPWSRCLEPKFLAARGLPPSLGVWYARLLASANSDATADWIAGSGAALRAVPTSVKGLIVNELCINGDERLRIAVLRALPQFIADFNDENLDVESAIALVTSKDEDVASAAMDFIEQYDPPSARTWLYWLPDSAGKSLKDRAREYLKN